MKMKTLVEVCQILLSYDSESMFLMENDHVILGLCASRGTALENVNPRDQQRLQELGVKWDKQSRAWCMLQPRDERE